MTAVAIATMGDGCCDDGLSDDDECDDGVDCENVDGGDCFNGGRWVPLVRST